MGSTLCILCIGLIAQAQKQTYTVKQGDSLSKIAAKVGVSQSALLSANHLSSPHKLKLGMVLVVPHGTSKAPTKSGSGGYTVQKGDTDWTIAKKLNISVAQLHTANPGTKWERIRPGDSLRLPTAEQKARLAAKYAKAKGSGGYVVQSGENDWTIAKKFSITPSKLREMNPGVNWRALQLGQRISVPGAQIKLASAPSIKSRYAVINTTGVTVRKGPDVSHEAIAKADQSTPVTIIDKTGAWYKCSFPKGTIGWVRGDFLKEVSASTVAAARVKAKKAEVVAKASKPAAKTVVASTTRTSTRAGRGSHKPSQKEFVALSTSANSSEIIAYAKEFLGTRYSYGSMSRSATDCSGFSCQVFKQAGVKLPRTSREQSRVGQAVPRSQLKKGDLLFFATRGGRRVGHVAIYIGDNKFIHASSGGGRVKVDSLTGYYDRRFVGARRVKTASTPARHATRDTREAVEKKPATKVEAPEPSPVDQDEPAPTKGTDEIIK